LLTASLAAIAFLLRGPRRGLPPTKLQMNLSNDPNSSCTPRKARALPTTASTFARLRTMPSSFKSALFFAAV
jgi:hypothetical protein